MHSNEDAGSGQVSDTARAAAGDIASSAKDQARSLTDEARTEAEYLTGDVRDRLQEEARSQTRRASENLRQWSQDLDSMADRYESQSPVPGVVHQVAQSGIGAADYLDDKGVDGLVEEVKGFARRRPLAFLTGAAIVGFAIGRVIKAAPEEPGNAGAGDGQAEASDTGASSRTTMPQQSRPAAGETVPVAKDSPHRYRAPGGEEG